MGEAFREIMEPLDGRVIVATFASNIARIQQVLDAAADMDRKVAVIGRSMEQNFRIATDLGYLKYAAVERSWPRTRSRTSPADKLVIATTGAQGEPMAGLARMANRDHRFVEIQPGDTVIVSASPIPGNEEYVARTIDNLFKAGANVYYHTIKRAHVSGHASQEELKLMLGLDQAALLHPDARRVPDARAARAPRDRDRRPGRERVHHRERHADRDLRRRQRAPRAMPVAAGYVYVDGLSVGEVGDVVLRDRRALANDGMFMIVVQVDKQTGKRRRPARDHHPRVRARQRGRPADRGGDPPHPRRRSTQPGDRISEVALLKSPDQGQRVALPVRADEAAADGLPGRGRGLARGHATLVTARAHRLPARPAGARPRASRAAGCRSPSSRWGCRRSSSGRWSGSCCWCLGAVTLIALLLPGQGALTDGWRNFSVPFFGTGRWLLPFVLLLSGWYLEWGPGKEPGAPWGRTLLGIAMAYAGAARARSSVLARPLAAGASAGSSRTCSSRR